MAFYPHTCVINMVLPMYMYVDVFIDVNIILYIQVNYIHSLVLKLTYFTVIWNLA